MSTVGAAVNKQQDLHYRICRSVENLRKLGKDKITRAALNTRIQALDSNWDKFQTTHSLLIASQTDETRALEYFADDFYSVCEEAYLVAKTELVQLRDGLADTNSDVNETSFGASNSTALRVSARSFPKIAFPKFSGDYHTWPPFRDLFQSMIVGNPDLQPVEKLHYLKGHVTGTAARVLAKFAVTAANFSRAWDALVARYDNRRVPISAYLDQLFNLVALTRKSADGLKELWATVKEALGGLDVLGSPVVAWDHLVVYLVTRLLDPDSREAWEVQLGPRTEPATFTQLEEFIEGRIRALEMLDPRSVGKPSRASRSAATPQARAHAAASGSSKCPLCRASHYLFACPDFSAKSLDDRREFIIKKKLCFNCFGTHQLRECRSSKRCRSCNGHHHTLIYRAPAPTPSPGTQGKDSTSDAAKSEQPLASTSNASSAHHASAPGRDGAPPPTLLATERGQTPYV